MSHALGCRTPKSTCPVALDLSTELHWQVSSGSSMLMCTTCKSQSGSMWLLPVMYMYKKLIWTTLVYTQVNPCTLTWRLVALAMSIKVIINCKPFTRLDLAFRRVHSEATALISSVLSPSSSHAFRLVSPIFRNSEYRSGDCCLRSDMMESVLNSWRWSIVSGPCVTLHLCWVME